MTTAQQAAHDDPKQREGKVFYPTHHSLLGFADRATAERAHRALGGGADCVHVSAAKVVAEATAELEHPGLLAGFGSSLGVREQQLKLAREGAEFLLVKTADEKAAHAMLDRLGDIPLRYGVRYGSLVIENLIAEAPTVAGDAKPSRAS